jgi:spore maturation protein CgeB
MKLAFYGSSLLSSYWNGAATYYRGMLSELAKRGWEVTFYEPDAFERQQHRDIDPPEWATVVVYEATPEPCRGVIARAAEADVVVKASGVGVFDDELLVGVMAAARPQAVRIFWDVDAPATLAGLREDPAQPLGRALPDLDLVLTYGGGPLVVGAYEAFGARLCRPIYNALDPTTHHPAPAEARFAADLGFLANRLPDREARVERFFLEPAARLPERRFLLGGSGWDDKPMPSNVRRVGHVGTADHNAFNGSSLAVLNVARDSMADVGFSPATRVFEAAGAGACLITDAWEGVELFLTPEEEVLVARDGQDVADQLAGLAPDRARAIGEAARARILAEHTYARRAAARRRGGCAAAPRGGGEAGKEPGMKLVVLGLSLSSSWGNGHATTYRALLRAFAARGHEVLFLERDTPWYAAHRDLPEPDFCRFALYGDLGALSLRWRDEVAAADAVIVGSYVPEGVAVGRWVQKTARGATAFYDIDTPVTLARLEAGDHEYLSPELIPGYGLYLSFTGGPTLRRIERRYGSPAARALYCSVDAEAYRPRPQPRRWDLSYLGTYSPDRQPVLERLLLEPARRAPDLAFCVAGPQYPDDIDWPANVERIEHVPPSEHPAFYAASRFTLNVTRADMVAAGWSPSVRLFEAAACAAPIVSDVWEGLGALFEPGREIVLAETPEAVLRVLRETSEAERGAMAESGRRRILAEHTAAHRADELETHLLQAIARAQRDRREGDALLNVAAAE